MKILMVSWEYPPVMVGGLGIHVNRLVRELAHCGHEVVVVVRSPAQQPGVCAQVSDEMRDGIRVLSVPLTPLALDFTTDLMAWTLLMGTAMNRAITHLFQGTGPCASLGAWTPDVVHGHDWLVAVPAVAAADVCSAPLVGTFHATEAGRNSGWLSHPINRQVHSAEWWFAHACDHLITCSTSMTEEVEEAFHRPDTGSMGMAPLHTIPNGIDAHHWVVDRRPSRLTSAPHVVYVGRLEWEKGVHDILSALPQLRRRYPGIYVTIAGEGMKKDWLLAERRRHLLTGQVDFVGYLPETGVRELFSQADVAVVPSRYEPFGIAALEAAAAGVPLVATSTGGLADIVVDGVTGWSYSPGIIEDMVEAIDDALRHPEERDRRASHAQSQLGERYCWTSIAQQTVAVYEEAVQGASRNAQRPLPRPLIPLRPLPLRDPSTAVDPQSLIPSL